VKVPLQGSRAHLCRQGSGGRQPATYTPMVAANTRAPCAPAAGWDKCIPPRLCQAYVRVCLLLSLPPSKCAPRNSNRIPTHMPACGCCSWYALPTHAGTNIMSPLPIEPTHANRSRASAIQLAKAT